MDETSSRRAATGMVEGASNLIAAMAEPTEDELALLAARERVEWCDDFIEALELLQLEGPPGGWRAKKGLPAKPLPAAHKERLLELVQAIPAPANVRSCANVVTTVQGAYDLMMDKVMPHVIRRAAHLAGTGGLCTAGLGPHEPTTTELAS